MLVDSLTSDTGRETPPALITSTARGKSGKVGQQLENDVQSSVGGKQFGCSCVIFQDSGFPSSGPVLQIRRRIQVSTGGLKLVLSRRCPH